MSRAGRSRRLGDFAARGGRRGRRVSARGVAAYAAVGVLAALVVAGAAVGRSGAAAVRPLVSNIDELFSSAPDTANYDFAQGFQTGGLESGYLLDSVEIRVLQGVGSVGLSVTLHKDDPASAAVATLSVPSTIPDGVVAFGAPAGTVLEPNSTYYVVIQEDFYTAGRVILGAADSDGEDGDLGWEVFDTVHRRAADSTGAFAEYSTASVMMRVNGQYAAVGALVGNVGQSAGSSESLQSYDVAQGFETGGGLGYLLDGVDVLLAAVSATDQLSVTLHADDPAGSAVAALASAESLVVGVNSFDAPGETVLDRARAYFVVVQGSGYSVGLVSSDAEDPGASAGWSVGDGRRRRAHDSSGAFEAELVESLGIRVRGAALASGELSGLELADDRGSVVPWTQGEFRASTTAYSAGVLNAVSEVTVIATPAPGSTAAVTCPDPSVVATPGTCSLAEGPNLLRVEAVSLYGFKKAYGLYVVRAAAGEPAPEPALPVPEVSLSFTEVLVGEDNRSADLEVRLSEVTPQQVTVRVSTADGTAISPRDFTAMDSTLVFAPGETAKTVEIQILDDGSVEEDEQFTVSLSDVSAAATLGSDAVARVTIEDDDALNVRMRHATYLSTEGDVVEASVITISPVPGTVAELPIVVHVATADGTARGGKDFVADYWVLTIEPGETEASFEVKILDDALFESGREAFSLHLQSFDHAIRVSRSGHATVSITDNDTAPVVSVGPVAATEGSDLMFPVSLDAVSDLEVSVEYSVAAGTASEGDDYVVRSRQNVSIAAGERSTHIRVGTVADGAAEGVETLTVTLLNPTLATLGTQTAQGDIADAARPGVTVTPQALTVREARSGSYYVRLGSAPAAGETVTVTPRPTGAAVSVSPVTVDFTDSNWDSLQRVTVTAADDADRRDGAVTVAHTVSGGNYSPAPPVRVTVLDDDRTTPQAPPSLTATRGRGQVTLRWEAPDDGGYQIDGYEVSLGMVDNAYHWRHVGLATSHTVRSVPDTVSPKFWVRARNKAGHGAATGPVLATNEVLPPPRPTSHYPPFSFAPAPPAAPEPVMFSDVAEDAWYGPDVARIAAAGVTTGFPDGTYRPNEPVSRAQMATLLARALGVQPAAAPVGRFKDVAADSSHAGNVERIAELGITVGCDPDGMLYCPRNPVTRSQMALFLKRAFDLPDAEVDEPSFVDVPVDHYAHGAIEALRAAGITVGCRSDPPQFCGTRHVSRAQMAAFLSRALDYQDDP